MRDKRTPKDVCGEANVGPQKRDLKLSVLCQLAWFLSLLCLHCSSAHTPQDVTKTRNDGERGNALGGTPYNGLYRTGTFSGFRFMKG